MKACPLCTGGPQGDRVRVPPPRTHTKWTRHQVHGLRLQDPGAGYILSLAFRAQPAPETALGWASPGQARPNALAFLPPGPYRELGREQLLSTPGTALKKTGDRAHLAGLWRGLPICLSGLHALPHFFSISKSGRKGAKQENGSQSPSPRAGPVEDEAGTS